MKLIVASVNQSVDWTTLCDITTLIISLLVQEVITKIHTNPQRSAVSYYAQCIIISG